MKNRILIVLTFAVATLVPASADGADALTGRWSSGRLSTIQYRDAYTGVDRPPAGNYFAYEFRPDGTYTFSGLVQTTLYNCTTSLFGEESGTYQVNGSEVALRPLKNPFRMTNSCAPSSNRQGPGKLTARSFRFAISGDQIELTALQDGLVSRYQKDRAR